MAHKYDGGDKKKKKNARAKKVRTGAIKAGSLPKSTPSVRKLAKKRKTRKNIIGKR